jgi:hypothetical protein
MLKIKLEKQDIPAESSSSSSSSSAASFSSTSALWSSSTSWADHLLSTHPDAHRVTQTATVAAASTTPTTAIKAELKAATTKKKPATKKATPVAAMVMPRLQKIEKVEPRQATDVPPSEPLKCLWSETPVVACADIEGRSAAEIERHQKISFVCQYCALPVHGFCLGFPRSYRPASASKEESKREQWSLVGQFGSVGCLMRSAKERRYSWIKETGGYIALMLVRVYGCSISKVEKILPAPAKEDLPMYNDVLWQEWQAGKTNFDSQTFHSDPKYQPADMTAPDVKKHDLQSEPRHCLLQYHGENSESTRYDTPAHKWSSMKHLLELLPNWQVSDPTLTVAHLQSLAN